MSKLVQDTNLRENQVESSKMMKGRISCPYLPVYIDSPEFFMITPNFLITSETSAARQLPSSSLSGTSNSRCSRARVTMAVLRAAELPSETHIILKTKTNLSHFEYQTSSVSHIISYNSRVFVLHTLRTRLSTLTSARVLTSISRPTTTFTTKSNRLAIDNISLGFKSYSLDHRRCLSALLNMWMASMKFPTA